MQDTPEPLAPDPDAQTEGKTRIPRGHIIVALFVCVVVFGLLGQSVRNAREAARRSGCISNLFQIGIGIEQYTSDMYYGDLPADTGTLPEKLYEKGNGVVAYRGCFLCPSSSTPREYSGPLRCDYIFAPRRTLKDPPGCIVAVCPIHQTLLFKDTHVKSYTKLDRDLFLRWLKAFQAGDPAADRGPDLWQQQQAGNEAE